MLSAKEIIFFHKNPVKPLAIPGLKSLVPQNTEEEKAHIKKCLESFKNMLSYERVERRHMRSEAEWLASECVAKITRRVGKIYPQYGHQKDGQIYLSPEEALFLLEMNRLELLWNGVPFSIESAYTTLLGKNSKCTFIQYRTYRDIAIQGLHVQHSNKHSRMVDSDHDTDNSDNDDDSDASDTVKKIKLDPDLDSPSTSDRNKQILISNNENQTNSPEYDELFKRLKESGPSTSSYFVDASPTYDIFPPNVCLRGSLPQYQVIVNSGNEQLPTYSSNPDNVPTLTSLSGLNSVAFFQLEKVDLDNPQ